MYEGIYKLPVEYQISDIDIFAYKGVKMPYKKIDVTIQQLSCYDWFYIYLPMMSKMVNYFYTILPNVELLQDYKNMDNVNKFQEGFLISLQEKRFRNHLLAMFKQLNFFNCSIKKFLKYIDIMELCEMFLLTYLFNTEGLKKKLKFLIEKVYTVKKAISGISSPNVKKTVGSTKIVDKINRVRKDYLKK